MKPPKVQSKKMKILFITHRIPYPPNKGDKIRSFHQIQYLSRENQIHLACLVDDKEDLGYVEALRKYCKSVDTVYINKAVAKLRAVWALFTGRPLSVASFYSNELKKRIDQRLDEEKFDIVFVFSSAMAQYVMDIKQVPKVMDFVDVDSEKWKHYAGYYPFPISLIFQLEGYRLAKFEEKVSRSFNHSIFVSESEAALFKQRVKDRPISFVRNGVDLHYYQPKESVLKSYRDSNIVFTGMMDYFPNVDAVRYFAIDIFPLIRKVIPEAKFYIVGRNPTRQVLALRKQLNVYVTGAVSDVRPFLASAKVSVAPFRIARGTQNKILEAMAMGIPVVATSKAYQGIASSCREGILLADDSLGFSNQVIEVLSKDSLFRALSKKGRRNMEENCDWDSPMRELERILEKSPKYSH